MKIVLTEEGKEYLRRGLPEKRLIEILSRPMSISEARRRVDNFGIALTWAKKNKWVRVDAGNLIPTKKPKSIPEQAALEAVSKGRPAGRKTLSILMSRKLVREVREDIFTRAEKQAGREVRTLTPELIKTGFWEKVKLKPYKVEAVGRRAYPGKRQPYNQFLSQVRRKLVELGFMEMEGPIIETEFWNFDALYQAQDHPSRDWTQTYTLKKPRIGKLPRRDIVSNVKAAHENGWKTGSTGWGYRWSPEKAARLMPRAHGTALTSRQLAAGVEIPGKYFAMVRCFRPDVIDATHGVEFNQIDGFVVDENLNFRHLLGLLKMFAKEMAGADKVKFYTDYYPFTEPSVQISAKHPEIGWMELAGAGIFRPELTEPLGIKQPVIAWGIGVDRLAMYKLNIKDIRYLFSQDIKWLREQKVMM